MAESIITKLEHLKTVATKSEARYAKKSALEALKAQVAEMEASSLPIGSVYRPGGSYAFASLPAPSAETLGMVYNVTDAFTTTAQFVEGADIPVDAGANVAVVERDGVYKFDLMGSGMVDTSGLVEKETGKGLSSNDFTDADKEKLDGIRIATDVEVDAMLEAVYVDDDESEV